MIVVLMGYMGSGKSFVGRFLAEKLNYDFIDLDDLIESEEKRTIPEIFKTNGAIYFRKIETQYLSQTLNFQEDLVLALGGGTPCYGSNLDIILNNDNVVTVYLKASVNYLSERLITEKNLRPLIAEVKNSEEMKEFVGKHLFERSRYYNEARITVVNEDKEVENIVEDIIAQLF